MNQEDIERAEKSLHHCLKLVAINLINGKDNPYYLKNDEIERNGTTRKKDIRLLWEAYQVCNNYFKRAYEEHSDKLIEPFVFPDVPEMLSTVWDSNETHVDENFLTTLGFICLRKLPVGKVIYIQKNINSYYVLKDEEVTKLVLKSKYISGGDAAVYPSNLFYDKRKRDIAAYVFKLMAEKELRGWLEKRYRVSLVGMDIYTELNGKESYSTDLPLSFKLPSYQNLPCLFQSRFLWEGKHGNFFTKYTKTLDIFNEIIDNLKRLREGIKKDGGFKHILKCFVDDMREMLVEEGPLLIAKDPDVALVLISYECFFTYENIFGRNYNEQS